MKVLINNEEISITLEGEKTVKEVYNGLSKQFSTMDKQISGIRVDGNYINLNKAETYSLETVAELNFDIVSTGQLFLDSLIEMSNYLGRALEFVQRRPGMQNISQLNPEERNNLGEGIRWLDDSLDVISGADPRLMEILERDNSSEEPDMISSPWQFFKKIQSAFENPEEEKNLTLASLAGKFAQLKENIDLFLKTMKDATPSEQEIIGQMGAFIAEIPEINAILSRITDSIHEGKDRDAFELARQVSLQLQKYLILVPSLEQSGITHQVTLTHENFINLHQVNKQILENLSLMADSMENNDSVTITDLAEYEFPELLALLPDAYSKIKSHYN